MSIELKFVQAMLGGKGGRVKRFVLLPTACWFLLAPSVVVAQTSNVLVIFSNNRLLPANIEVDRGLQEGIARSADRTVALFAEFLDQPAFTGQAYQQTITTYLREKYTDHPPSTIVVTGEFALEFLLHHRADLFPDVPLVFVPVDRSFSRSHQPLPADVVVVPVDYDYWGTIELALSLHPHTRRLVLVTGTSDWDLNWESDLRGGLVRLGGDPSVEFIAGLSTDAVVKRLAELGRGDVVFTPGYFRDGAGRVFAPREAAVIMAASSGAPVYAPFSTFIGAGVVGGRMPTYVEMGRQAAKAVNAILDGTPAAAVRLRRIPAEVQIDWRQARKWGIGADEIPSDAIIHFKEPSLLEAHQTDVEIAIIVFLLQAALIVALLLERGRRRTAEWEVQKRYSEMAHMNRRVAMGELSASIAHELNQPLGAIHNNAGAAQMLIQANPPKLRGSGGDSGRHQARRPACQRRHCKNSQDAAQDRIRDPGHRCERDHRGDDEDAPCGGGCQGRITQIRSRTRTREGQG